MNYITVETGNNEGLLLDVGLLYERLAQIADARQARGKRYPASARRFFNAKLDTQLLSLP